MPEKGGGGEKKITEEAFLGRDFETKLTRRAEQLRSRVSVYKDTAHLGGKRERSGHFEWCFPVRTDRTT